MAEEPLATRSRVRAPKIGLTNGAVDQSKVGDSRVLLDDLRVDDRRENDVDALRCARPQHDLHPPTLIGSPDALLLAICGMLIQNALSKPAARFNARTVRSRNESQAFDPQVLRSLRSGAGQLRFKDALRVGIPRV